MQTCHVILQTIKIIALLVSVMPVYLAVSVHSLLLTHLPPVTPILIHVTRAVLIMAVCGYVRYAGRKVGGKVRESVPARVGV